MVHAVFCLVSALTIMAAVVPLACAGEVPKGNENTTANITANMTSNTTLNAQGSIISNETRNAAVEGKVLRAGSESTKAPKVLGWKSSRRTAGIKIGLETKSELNLSQRQGSVSKFKFNSDIYTPFFIQNQYMRTKPSISPPERSTAFPDIHWSCFPAAYLRGQRI